MTPSNAWQRFLTKIDAPDAAACWRWMGAIRSRYGVFCGDGVHRWAYEQMVGPIADGLQIDHLCHNKLCVNPIHLEPVTPSENVRRQREHVGEKLFCRKGHEKTGRAARGYNGKQPQRVCYKCQADNYYKHAEAINARRRAKWAARG